MSYRFFFSYSRETYEASSAVDGVNHLDQFYEDLTKQVSLLTGDKINAVAARDTDRLRISDNWGDELINFLQEASVLVCIITPHYLKSIPCGREVELFRQRHAQLDGKLGGNRQRILLVFWIEEPQCYQEMFMHVKEFVRNLQLTEKGLPHEYLRVGLLHFYGKRDGGTCYIFRELLAKRIKELSELPNLPALPPETKFNNLPSFFEKREITGQVAVGPLGTNVVYAVATDQVQNDKSYGAKSEDWRPFLDKPNRTIALLTQAALADAGQRATEYRAITPTKDLVRKVKEAREVNSPVLIVLDQSSLHFDMVKEWLTDYDTYDGPNVGLVTASGVAADQPLLPKVFPMKYGQSRPHHLWTVPPDSGAYERSVGNIVSALRADLQKQSDAIISVQTSPMPSL